MYAKSLLIPIAAFALSATGVSAFNPDVLQNVGLSDDQISAFEDARGLRQEGQLEKARDVLKNAGITVETMERMRKAIQKQRETIRTAIDQTVETDNYLAFKEAVVNLPLYDIITSKEDFELFKQAHELHRQGENTQTYTILDELGFDTVQKNRAFPPFPFR